MDGVFERIRSIQTTLGAVPSPFDCWLVLRGLRSLPYRMRGHVEGAQRVAGFLAAHPAVARVYYPGLSTDPGYEVASRQMRQPGGMLSFDVRGGRAEAFALVNRLKLVTRATSLGGPETLIEHRASVEGEHTRAPESLLRVSIGLEHPDDLIEDFAQALEVTMQMQSPIADSKFIDSDRHRVIVPSCRRDCDRSAVAVAGACRRPSPCAFTPRTPTTFSSAASPLCWSPPASTTARWSTWTSSTTSTSTRSPPTAST